MTHEPSPLDTALDLLVYAPLGLAVTIGEELPKLADKGRDRMESRLGAARLLGQFAVAAGRQQLARQAGPLFSRPAPPPTSTAPPGPAAPTGEPGSPPTEPLLGTDGAASEPTKVTGASSASPPAPLLGRTGGSRSPGGTHRPRPAATRPVDSPGGPRSRSAVSRRQPPSAGAASAGPGSGSGSGSGFGGRAPDASGLAIPGYASLSASQVVQRLAGLSAAELEAVRRYEAATRGRRTILTRVAQLQSS